MIGGIDWERGDDRIKQGNRAIGHDGLGMEAEIIAKPLEPLLNAKPTRA